MLETKNLTKRFGGRPVLDNVSFDIEAGHTYLLLGPNGSGKTTWMKTAASLTKPSEGGIYWNDAPVGIESRKEISYMPTESYFFDWMSVGDVGQYFADFFDDFDMEKFEQLLSMFGLTRDMKVKNLSSGMNAKLRLAACLARKAYVYLLDEPLNGVDLIAADQVIAAVIQAMDPAVAIVISSHQVEKLESLASTAIFIRDGHILDIVDTEKERIETKESLADRYRELMA